MKCKPIVYFSPRHTLSPTIIRAVRSLSRHVTIVGQTEDPQTAYTSIHDSDVVLCYLNATICSDIFLMYELGVALVLRKPLIVIRETTLKFSEIFIPKHFYETQVLVPPIKTGAFQTCNMFGKTCNLPITLGDVLAYAYDNSMIFCPDLHAKCVALLLDKILGLSREIGTLLRHTAGLKISQKPTVTITVENSKSTLGLKDCSIQTDTFERGKISLLPLRKDSGDHLKTTLPVHEDAIDQLSGNEESALLNYAPEISITRLKAKDDSPTDKNKFEPVSPVFFESPEQAKTVQDDCDEGFLDASDSSSTCDVAYLHDKTFIASANTSPLPSPIPPRGVYYPTALPVYPMELCFPPFQVEKLQFDKHALQIAKADRLPSIVRRRIMRKDV